MDRLARGARAAVAAALMAAPAWCGAVEEVVTIPTRDGVTESYLITHNPSAAPSIAVIAFIGGNGAINLGERAKSGPVRFGPTTNFLIRFRGELANRQIASVVVDAPSDQLPQGMSDNFRMSAAHAADIRAVIADLERRYPGIRIDLMGTSRGTISAAPLAAELGSTIHGVVLSSTVTIRTRAGAALSAFDFATIKVPVLFVHHRDDGCAVSPYANVTKLAKYGALITVTGNDPPQSDPCEPLSQHGYIGRDAQVASAVREWLLGEDFPREIP